MTATLSLKVVFHSSVEQSETRTTDFGDPGRAIADASTVARQRVIAPGFSMTSRHY